MASEIQLLLTSYLDILSKKDLEEFLLQLMDKESEGHSSKMTPFQLEKANGMEIASLLVAQYGEQKAWELAILTWEKMGLKDLSALAKAQSNFRSGEYTVFCLLCSSTSSLPLGIPTIKSIRFPLDFDLDHQSN